MLPRRVIAVVAIAAVVFLTSSPIFAADKIRVGLSSVSSTSGSLWVADDKGLFKKYGIDAEFIVLGGGGARVISSLISGEIQFSVGGGEGSVRSALRGADVVIVASSMTKGLQRLMTRPEIKSYQELKNKKIAITRFGSAGHLALLLMLKKWNMRPEDLQILQLESSPAMLATMDKGGLDGAVLTMPSFFLAEDKGYRVLGDPADMDIVYLQNTLESTRAFVRKNRDTVLRFLKGYIEGIAYFKKYKAESFDVMRKRLRIQSQQERDNRYLELSYNLLVSKYYNDAPYPSVRAVQTILDNIAADEPKARGADPRAHVDESLVRELDDSGFIKSVTAK
jgi:ABC-type nitrate/sulfonate/bicarbonate transport system substrate-binding protein